MEKIFRFFIERHLFALLFSLTAIAVGAYTLTFIKRDNFPEVDMGRSQIMTTYPGASPEDVELRVTNKIEKELHAVTGIEFFTSYSFENFSIIDVRYDQTETDFEKVTTDIRDSLDRVGDLPKEVTEKPQLLEFISSNIPVIELGVHGDVPYAELREAARHFEKRLRDVHGVAQIYTSGWREREIKIEVSPEKTAELNLNLYEVIEAISEGNVRGSGGSLESYTSQKNIVTLSQFRDPAEARDVVVRSTFDGPQFTLGDIAKVHDGFEEETVRTHVNGKASILFEVWKADSADVIRLVNNIRELIEDEKRFLPEGVELLSANDQSRLVRSRFSIVLNNGFLGLLLLLGILSVFLSKTIALWVAIGIPVTFSMVIAVLPALGLYLDSITLTAMILLLGIIVDDAIIIAENIQTRYERGNSATSAAAKGLSMVFLPVLTTVLTTFAAFAPFFFMPGMMGRFTLVIPITVTVALLCSLLEATVALPSHIAYGLRPGDKERRLTAIKPVSSSQKKWFRTLVFGVLRHRYLCFLGFVILLLGTITYTIFFIDFILFPSAGSDQFRVQLEMPVGSSLDATEQKVKEIENVLHDVAKDAVTSYTSRAGQKIGELGEVLAFGEHFGHLSVQLTPHTERDLTADDIVELLRAKTNELKGIRNILFLVNAGGPPVGRPITVRAVSSDENTRQALTNAIVQKLKDTPGVKDIDRSDILGKQQLEIKPNRKALARLGLSIADVAQYVRIAYDGETVTTVRYGEDDTEFRVSFDKESREHSDFLGRLQLPNDKGRLIKLSQIAKVESSPGPAAIYHFNGERAVSITADVDKRVTSPLTVMRELERSIDMASRFPKGRLAAGGEAEEARRSVKALFKAFILAALGIYALLVLLFNSPIQPIVILVAVPFGVIGVLIAFALHSEPLGYLAVMGLVGLSGVVVNDSIVLVSHINRLRQAAPSKDILVVIAWAASDRLRAISITTITTVGGLLPLAYGIGGYDHLMSPMALAMGWGLVFGTSLTLFLTPCLYGIAYDLEQLIKRLFKR